MGYYDTKQKIVNSLLGRPDGTQIQPDNHQDFALSLLEYIRSVELISGSTLIGIADVTTVPVQSDDANECYVSACPVGAVLTYENFHGQDGNPITYSADQNSGALLLLLWNKQYWELVDFPTTIQVTAEIINYASSIRKTYASKEAMEADTNPFGDDGKAIVPGQLVTVVNSTDTTYNGIYARTQNGTWKFQSGFNWSLVQNIGDDANTAMSQKAVTDELNLIHAKIKAIEDAGYIFAGIATPATNPGTPDGSVFYLASESGTYTNFGAIELQNGLSILTWNGSWSSLQIFGVDDEPTAGSDNLVKSGGVTKIYGKYIENPEFVRVYTDAEDKILWGIKKNGGIYYGAGIPQQVIDYIEQKIADLSLDEYEDIVAFLNDLVEGDKTLQMLLNEKVDKEEGKSLINAEYAEDVHYIESPEFAEVKLDAEERILEATYKDGTKLFPAGFRVNGIAEYDGATVTSISNPEFVAVWVDNTNRILLGIKNNADIFLGYGVPSQIKDYIDEEINKVSPESVHELIDFIGEYLGSATLQELLDKKVDGEYTENPEYVEAKVDAENKLIEGIKADGTKVVNTPIDTPSFATDNIDNPEWMTVLTDKQGKILRGRYRNGVVKEYIGYIIKKLLVEEDAVFKGSVHYDKIPTQIKEYVDGSVVVQEQMPNYLQLSRQSDNIINIIGYDSFLDKTMVVVSPDKYSSWSRLGVVGDTLICLYCRGLEHADPNKGQLYEALSANGIIWTPKKLVIDTPNVRDGVTGGGNDENGNMLFIDRVGVPGGTSTYHEIYRTTDGINYEKIASLPSSVNLGHCGDIVNIPTRGLMAFFGCYGTQADYGYILSNDNGATWSRVVIENVVREERPMEMSAAYIGDGKILVVGRYEGSGSSHMWQLQSEDYGETWVKAATNISGNSNTPSIIYNNETQMLSLYIYNRANGQLEYRECAIDDIWDNPTNWTSPTILAHGAIGQDAGNVTTCVFNGHQIVSWYSGNAVDTGIYNLIKL